MSKDIKLGFWNYAPFGVIKNKEVVKDWLEVGSNLPMSFVFDYKTTDKKEMLELLDECQKHSLKLIVSDTRTLFTNLRSMNKEQYRKLVQEAYDDFGHHPATFGFYVGDEPSPEETDLFIDAMNIVIEESHGLVPFGNLLPYFGCIDVEVTPERDAKYRAIVEKILKETKVSVIGYDQYSQLHDEYCDQELGISRYYHGLECYYEITKKYNVPLYMSLLSIGHWNYRVPNEDDIRWQIYTSLAHGVRGIIWFYFYQTNHDYSYRGGPYTNFEMKKTEMFEIIKRQQYLFKVGYEEQFNKMELEYVYHFTYGKDKVDERLKDIYVDRPYPVIVSYYKEFNSDKKWVSFVNGSQKLANKIDVTFKNGVKEAFWLAPGEMRLFDLSEYE